MSGKLLFAASNTCSDILYASHFFACDPFLYFSVEQTEGIIVSALEYGRAEKEVKTGVKVYEVNDIMGKCSTVPHVKDIILKLNQMFPGNTWKIPASFPFSLGKFLLDNNVKLDCSEKPFFEERNCKTKIEVNSLRHALKLAEKAMQKAADLISESRIDNNKMLILGDAPLTSERIKAEIAIEIIKGGAVAAHTIVACGVHSADPHHTGSGALFAEQPIVLDIFPRLMETDHNDILPGYWGDISRTFLKGKAPDIINKIYDAVKEARDSCEKMVKEGAIPADLHNNAQDILRKNGFETGKDNGHNYGFFHGLGHGVGLDIHEGPSISSRNKQALKAGNVITVEPGLYYPEFGGVRLENMVLVEKESCQVLTEFPDFLEIK